MTKRPLGIRDWLVLLVAVPGLLLSFPAAAQEQPQGEQDAAPAPAADQEQPPSKPQRALKDRMWWNRDGVVEALGLKPEQRQGMDDLLADYQSSGRELRKKTRDTSAAMAEALKAGKWEEAKKLNAEAAALAAKQIAAEPELKINVLRALTPEQLSAFAAKYPNLFKRSWLTRPRHAPRRRGAAKAPAVDKQDAAPAKEPG